MSSFGRSVLSGVTGLVEQPLKGANNDTFAYDDDLVGAEKEGVGGFFKGIGKGVVGVLAKPAVGLFDMASHTAEGVRNSTQRESVLERVRLPRHIGADGVVKVFSQREADGANMLRMAAHGHYESDIYITHVDLFENNLLMVTSKRVMLLSTFKLHAEWMAVLGEIVDIQLSCSSCAMKIKTVRDEKSIDFPDLVTAKQVNSTIADAIEQFKLHARGI